MLGDSKCLFFFSFVKFRGSDDGYSLVSSALRVTMGLRESHDNLEV